MVGPVSRGCAGWVPIFLGRDVQRAGRAAAEGGDVARPVIQRRKPRGLFAQISAKSNVDLLREWHLSSQLASRGSTTTLGGLGEIWHIS